VHRFITMATRAGNISLTTRWSTRQHGLRRSPDLREADGDHMKPLVLFKTALDYPPEMNTSGEQLDRNLIEPTNPNVIWPYSIGQDKLAVTPMQMACRRHGCRRSVLMDHDWRRGRQL